MKTWLLFIWEDLRNSLWFVPSIMTIGAILLSFLMLALDESVRYEYIKGLLWIYKGGAEGARLVLSTIAGSMITVAGVVFSITIVSLSLASSQFGPRLLRNFVRDPGNQVVLGTFIATFIYCLMILRTVRSIDERGFVPYLSVTTGVVLAMISLGVLIYFIHHVASVIQADHVIAVVTDDFLDTIDRLFPERLGHESGNDDSEAEGASRRRFNREGVPVVSANSGYIQEINGKHLMGIAVENDLMMKLLFRPGEFIVAGIEIATVWPARSVSSQVAGEIADQFILGVQRTPIQDVEFAINQLVEVALRALSPGINDPFTAITCIDRITEGLCSLFDRAFPSSFRRDEKGVLRVIAPVATRAGLLDSAFNQIRQHAYGNVAITARLLEVLAIIAQRASRSDLYEALQHHADMIHRGAMDAIGELSDRNDIEVRYRLVREVLARKADSPSMEAPPSQRKS